jgi:hypothetical protein
MSHKQSQTKKIPVFFVLVSIIALQKNDTLRCFMKYRKNKKWQKKIFTAFQNQFGYLTRRFMKDLAQKQIMLTNMLCLYATSIMIIILIHPIAYATFLTISASYLLISFFCFSQSLTIKKWLKTSKNNPEFTYCIHKYTYIKKIANNMSFLAIYFFSVTVISLACLVFSTFPIEEIIQINMVLNFLMTSMILIKNYYLVIAHKKMVQASLHPSSLKEKKERATSFKERSSSDRSGGGGLKASKKLHQLKTQSKKSTSSKDSKGKTLDQVRSDFSAQKNAEKTRRDVLSKKRSA